MTLEELAEYMEAIAHDELVAAEHVGGGGDPELSAVMRMVGVRYRAAAAACRELASVRSNAIVAGWYEFAADEDAMKATDAALSACGNGGEA